MTRTNPILSGLALVFLLGTAACREAPQPETPAGVPHAAFEVPAATPMGITIQSLDAGLGAAAFGIDGPRILADAEGRTLYVSDHDTQALKSACGDECLKSWQPLAAPDQATGAGAWASFLRDDGSKQWAHKGRPLYTFAEDRKPGDVKGQAAEGGKWRFLLFQPEQGLAVPDGIEAREVPDAHGFGFATSAGLTLYVFEGALEDDTVPCPRSLACQNFWTPFEAPMLANPVGDFSTVSRPTGIRQWVYRGRPLYTFSGDIEPGDANGLGVDRRWQPALYLLGFAPPGVRMQSTVGMGKVWADAGGMTLYRPNLYVFQQSGHGLRRGTPFVSHIGRVIGTACDAECRGKWKPLVAAPDAQSSGYWMIVARDDGTRQWAYKSYALYTYAEDTMPGDLHGNDAYRLSFDSAAEQRRGAAPATVYWSHAYP